MKTKLSNSFCGIVRKAGRENMKDKIKQWLSNFIKILGGCFGILGAVSILFPFTEATSENVGERIRIFIAIIALCIVATLIWTISVILKKRKKVYSKGATKIIFEYSDIKEIISNTLLEEDEVTIVIPVNTDLQSVFNREKIYKNTIHRICLDYVYEKTGHELDYNKLINIQIRNDGFDYNGKKGDWFLLPNVSPDEKGKVNFMFVEFFDLEKRDGKMIISELEKEQYMDILQTVILAISKTERESKIFIPLIGAGAGNVDTPKEIMHFMNAMLRFNKSQLRQEIHIVINEKYRNDAPIYQLTNIQ